MNLATFTILPDNRGGGHEIANAQAGSLLGVALGSSVLPVSACQRRSKSDLNHAQPDEGEAESDNPDSEDFASDGVCFHDPTLSRMAPRVLIERI